MSKRPKFTINPEVSDYMEETGSSLDEAANEMGLNWDEVWDTEDNDES